MDRVSTVCRRRHFSPRTEEAYVHWIHELLPLSRYAAKPRAGRMSSLSVSPGCGRLNIRVISLSPSDSPDSLPRWRLHLQR
jgi:hypothetical protein